MSCQLKSTQYCQNKDCNEAIEKKCKSFVPPKMTAKEYSVKEVEILKDIPQEFKSALGYMAFAQGHAYGYEEVLSILANLIANFQKPIQEFENRIRRESKENGRNNLTSPPNVIGCV